MGTEMICAPKTSFNFQPNPLDGPYCWSIAAGAFSGWLWHARQSAVTRIGCAKYSAGPVGDSRSPVNCFSSGEFRKDPMMSASQSTARSRGLVGFSAVSLYVYSGKCDRM